MFEANRVNLFYCALTQSLTIFCPNAKAVPAIAPTKVPTPGAIAEPTAAPTPAPLITLPALSFKVSESLTSSFPNLACISFFE